MCANRPHQTLPTSEHSLHDLESPYYYALGADNRLLRVNVKHVVSVIEGPEGEIDPQDVDKVAAAVQRVRPVDWVNLSCEWSLRVVSDSFARYCLAVAEPVTMQTRLRLLCSVCSQWTGVSLSCEQSLQLCSCCAACAPCGLGQLVMQMESRTRFIVSSPRLKGSPKAPKCTSCLLKTHIYRSCAQSCVMDHPMLMPINLS